MSAADYAHVHVAADLIASQRFREAAVVLYCSGYPLGSLLFRRDESMATDEAYALSASEIRLGRRAFDGWGHERTRWFHGERCEDDSLSHDEWVQQILARDDARSKP